VARLVVTNSSLKVDSISLSSCPRTQEVSLGKTLNAISNLGAKQSTRCGGPAWRKSCKQNSFYVGVIWQTQSILQHLISNEEEDTTSELAGLSLHYLFNAERQAERLWKPTSLSLLVWLGQGIESRYTDYKTDALTTIDHAQLCYFWLYCNWLTRSCVTVAEIASSCRFYCGNVNKKCLILNLSTVRGYKPRCYF